MPVPIPLARRELPHLYMSVTLSMWQAEEEEGKSTGDRGAGGSRSRRSAGCMAQMNGKEREVKTDFKKNKNRLCSKTCGIDKIFESAKKTFSKEKYSGSTTDPTPKKKYGWEER